MGALLLLRDVARASVDAIRGQRRCRYEHSVDIAASRETVWALLKAADVTFDGVFPVRIVTDAVPGRPGVLRMQILARDTRLVMLARVMDEREGHAILFQILADDIDPVLLDGEDDYLGYVLDDVAGGSRLTITRELTVTDNLRRLTVPVAIRSGAARLKRKAEQMAQGKAAASAEPESI